MTAFTSYRWRKEFGGLKPNQVKERWKDLEKENERLRKAVCDLTFKKLILTEAASGNHRDRPGAANASTTPYRSSAF